MSDIIKTLVTDRTEADVLRWRSLRDKGYSNMTAEERAEWDAANMKGAYNASDLNRVGTALNYIRDRFAECGYMTLPRLVLAAERNIEIYEIEADVPDFAFKAGQRYMIFYNNGFDRGEYACTAQVSGTTVVAGNTRWLGGKNTGEPFCFITDAYGRTVVMSCNAATGAPLFNSHTAIYSISTFVHNESAAAYSARVNWMAGDIPTAADLTELLAYVATARAVLQTLPTTPETPKDTGGLSFAEANDIEQILVDVDQLITNMLAARHFCGELYSGEA